MISKANRGAGGRWCALTADDPRVGRFSRRSATETRFVVVVVGVVSFCVWWCALVAACDFLRPSVHVPLSVSFLAFFGSFVSLRSTRYGRFEWSADESTSQACASYEIIFGWIYFCPGPISVTWTRRVNKTKMATPPFHRNSTGARASEWWTRLNWGALWLGR